MCYLQNYVFQKIIKHIYVKVFNMITSNNEAKKMAKQISCDCKWKFNSATFNANQKWNNKTCKVRKMVNFKNILFRILEHPLLRLASV